MASTTRLLYYPTNVFRKILSIKLVGLSANPGTRVCNFHFLGYVKGLECNYCLFTCGNTTTFPLIHRTCAKSVTSVCDREAQSTSREQVDISRYPKAQLEKLLSFLTNEGFGVDDGIDMVSKCPDILRKTVKELDETIESLRRCRLRDEEIKTLLKSCPKILCSNPNAIVSRYQSLRQQFSHQLILQMLSNCPNIMLISWNNIRQNVEYLKNVMFVRDKQIAGSSALEYPLEVIKSRHVFLMRAGLYVTPDPKSNVPTKNPNLSSIIDTNDVYFAEKVAKLTAEEYFVFIEMFASECDQENDDEYDSEESE